MAFGVAMTAPLDAQPRQLKVLVLYGTPAGVPVQRSASTLIRERLARPASRGVSIYEEFFDDDWTFAPPGAPNTTRTERAEAFRQYLASRYAATKFDFILTVALPALDFYQNYGRALFPGTPVIASMVPSDVADRMPRDSLVSIVTDSIDLQGTLDLALTLQPATAHVVVIAGASPFDTSFLRRAQALRRVFEPRVDFMMVVGRPFGELERRVAALPSNSVILFLSTFADSSGNQYAMADIAEALRELPPEAASKVMAACFKPSEVSPMSLAVLPSPFLNRSRYHWTAALVSGVSSDGARVRFDGTRIVPRATALTRMPWGPSSTAAVRLYISRPALDAA